MNALLWLLLFLFRFPEFLDREMLKHVLKQETLPRNISLELEPSTLERPETELFVKRPPLFCE